MRIEPEAGPRAEYTSRLEARRAHLAREDERSRRIWRARRIVFAIAAAMVILSFAGWLAPWWLLVPLLIFIGLMARHQSIDRAREYVSRAVAYYERALARLDDRWAGGGETGARYADPSHPYAEDLDLFGPGSLFELLSTARTRAGEDQLAHWLRAPATIEEISARQAAVIELRPRLDLREDLALLGADVRAGVDPDALAAWGQAPPILFSPALVVIAPVLGVIALGAVVLWFGLGWRLAALAALLALSVFYYIVRKRVSRIIGAVSHPSHDLALLAQILGRLEREEFTAPRLVALRAALETEGQPPSRRIARLSRLIELLDSTRNQFFAPFAFLLLIPPQLAFAIERWRQSAGAGIGRWLSAVGEFEALSSLAGYSFEHPQDPFPELVAGGSIFEGAALAHPLIPASRAVRNDIALNDERRLLIVSGSNMSGKSTLLRTVGTNAVLAMAGAPVRAHRLQISPLAVGASIHILDSLQTGASRFYAEITRLRAIVELAEGGRPLLFLLDEILSGTNSHDRRIGAEAVVSGLVERGAIGLVTTHDLALTAIADELGARAANVHFEDHLTDGRMTFDYLMRPGVVRKSNAIELMRAVGLDV